MVSGRIIVMKNIFSIVILYVLLLTKGVLANPIGYLIPSSIAKMSLNGATICLKEGSSFNQYIEDYFNEKNWSFDTLYIIGSEIDSFKKLTEGFCDLYTNTVSELESLRSSYNQQDRLTVIQISENKKPKSKVLVEEHEFEKINWPANKDILNYGCIRGDLDCFCQRNSDNSIYIIRYDNTCGGSKYNNSNISYGEFLELGGLPQHCIGSCSSSIKKNKNDNSFEIEVFKENYIKFEPKTSTIKTNKVVSATAIIESELFCLNRGLRQRSLGTQFGKCPAGFKKISKEEFYSFPNLPIIDEKSEVAKSNTSQNTQESQLVVTSTKLDKKSLKEELVYWKELFEDELITQAEYDAKRKELLSGASVTTTTKVVEPKVEKKKVVVQKQETKNKNTKTVDISFKSKNYISQSLQGSLGFFANDGKIKDYCEDKYPKLHVYMECYAQNLKKSKVYKKARNLYDIYIELGRHLAWEAVLGNVSDSSARYQLAAKRQEMNDAYTENSSKKWKNIANALDDIKARHYPTPPPAENSNKQTCDIIYFNGKADRMTCK